MHHLAPVLVLVIWYRVLVSTIGRGQYYWVLGIGWLAWYRSNPTNYSHQDVCFTE